MTDSGETFGTRLRSASALIVSTGTCLLVGVSGSLVTATSVREWYPQIQKPPWTPPGAVFGPVWTVLYILMGVSVWLILRSTVGNARRTALLIFVTQLVLNSAWSFLFFGLRSPGWAALEIVLLWCSIIATMLAFARISRLAAGLLLPYSLWVSYAAALNVAIWNLNR
jgi:tryptophan-rich sensory protein